MENPAEDIMSFVTAKAQPSQSVVNAMQALEAFRNGTTVDPQAMSDATKQQLATAKEAAAEKVLPVENKSETNSSSTAATVAGPLEDLLKNMESTEPVSAEAADGSNNDNTGDKDNGLQDENGREEVREESLEESKEGEEVSNKEINFKQVRSALKESKAIIKAKETELSTLKEKLSKYETGEEVPEALAPLQTRVQELEKYERLHALKTSPAYKEAYIKPLQEVTANINALASDYKIPANVMERAMRIENNAELNQFLSDHFDDLGALEVKQLILKSQQLRNAAAEAESEPVEALQAIEEQHAQIVQAKRAQDNQVIAAVAKDSWVEALNEIQAEGKALELIHKPGDAEHNAKFVDPIINKAATETGRIIKLLAQNGLEKLPKDLAKAISKMVLYSHASAIAVETRAAAEKKLHEITVNTQRRNQFSRPSFVGNSVSVGNGRPQPAGPKTAMQHASSVLEAIGIKE